MASISFKIYVESQAWVQTEQIWLLPTAQVFHCNWPLAMETLRVMWKDAQQLSKLVQSLSKSSYSI